MFGIESSELAIIALVALLVIGPKDLPRAMRWVGQWVGKATAMSRHLRSGFDTMMREAELEEMQKVWAAQNEAIMKATALPNPIGDPFAPATTAAVAAAAGAPVAGAPDDWTDPPQSPDHKVVDLSKIETQSPATVVVEPVAVEPVTVEPVVASESLDGAAPARKPRKSRARPSPAASA